MNMTGKKRNKKSLRTRHEKKGFMKRKGKGNTIEKGKTCGKMKHIVEKERENTT